MQGVTPRVLQCNRFVLKNSEEHSRIVKDFELDLYLGEERQITVNGVCHKVPAGAVVYRKPEEFVSSRGDYDCYILTLDFEGTVKPPQWEYRRHRHGAAQRRESNPLFSSFPTVFIPKRINDIKELFKKIASVSYPAAINEPLARAYTEELLYLLLSELKSYESDALVGEGGSYSQKICAFINKNYKSNITIDEIARLVSLNKNYMVRAFKEDMGKTPISYLIETRLFYSTNLLVSTALSISDVAYECGFNSTAYFTKVFKKHYKTTPLDFRKKYQKN